MKKILMAAFTAVVMISCGTSANIENSWHDSEAQIDMTKANKVLVIAMLKNDVHRRAAESQLCTLLKNKGVPSYSYLTEELNELKEEAIKERLKKDGFDGVVILRLADVERDITYVPGSYSTYPGYYGRFWPYLSSSVNAYYAPGYFSATKKFTVETNVYSLRKDKLIWTSLTSYADPASAEKLMQAVAKEVHNRMKKDGFLINE